MKSTVMPFSGKYRYNRLSLLLLCLLVVFSLSSCIPADSIPARSDTASASVSADENTSVDESALPPVSGTLRLWMQQPDTFNPLKTVQLQWNSMIPLFYEGLFSINERQETVPVLAINTKISEDHLHYRIQIRQDVYFHDKARFTSADVEAVCVFLKDHPEAFPYSGLWASLDRIVVESDMEISFFLNAPDPFFLYRLTFPIVPAKTLSADYTGDYPGTGPYRILSYLPGQGMKARRNDAKRFEHFIIQNIDILELSGSREAMAAFEEDRVDMVVLDDALYRTYYLRNDLIQARFPGQSYLFYQFNDHPGKILHAKKKILAVKDALENLARKNTFGHLLLSSDVPYLNPAILSHNAVSAGVSEEALSQTEKFDIGKPLKLIFPADTEWISEYIQYIVEGLKTQGIPVNAVSLSLEEYQTTLQSADYDIALRRIRLDTNPDPSWLFFKEAATRFSGHETMQWSDNPEFLAASIALSKAYQTFDGQSDPTTFLSSLQSAFYHSPYSGVGFTMNAVILGKRVNGQLKSTRFNHFNGIGGIWVWSGH